MDPVYQNIGGPFVKLIEECSELIHSICKMERMGRDNYNPNDPEKITNEDKIVYEMDDVVHKMVEVFESIRKEHPIPRMWDFQARCMTCHKDLNIKLTRLPNNNLNLEPIHCKEHPDDSVILWPQREDLIHE